MEQEVAHWRAQAQALQGAQAARAEHFAGVLAPLCPLAAAMGSGGPGALAAGLALVGEGALEDALEELWRGPPAASQLRASEGFPQPRLAALLEALAARGGRYSASQRPSSEARA